MKVLMHALAASCEELRARTGNPPLRQKTINEFNALQQQQDMIRNAVRGMQKRALLCVERNGGMSKDKALNFVVKQ
jgi:hypothetical protein